MTDRPVGFGRREAAGSGGAGTPDAVPGAETLDDAAASALLPDRPARGHKGDFGKLLVIAGSLDYAGAALLVCRAAGRAGAGLVTLAVPESLQPLFAAKVVEATTMALPEDDVEEIDPEPALARILDHDHDAIVVGPGLRPGLAAAELVRELIAARADGADEELPPIVLDAEALRSLASMDGWWDGPRRSAVLTPHAGEFERLAGSPPGEDRVGATRKLADRLGVTVLLKGNITVIAEPGGLVYLNSAGQSWAATAGSGDVLSGIVGALLAAGLPSAQAAAAAAYVHARAANLSAADPGPRPAPTSASRILAHVRAAIASL